MRRMILKMLIAILAPMTVSKFHIIFLVFLWFIYQACSTPKQSAVQVPPEGEFFDQLSEYGLAISGEHGFAPAQQLIKYEVTNSLFSDYSIKERYVYIPEGQSAHLRTDGHFEWPEGSILVKNFCYGEEQVGEDRIMETRLLIKGSADWRAISYQWDENYTDAKKSKLGDIVAMEINQGDEKLSFDYIIPNKNQCKSCHNANEKIEPIGFKLANLDRKIKLDGNEVSQVDHLVRQGIIKLNQEIDLPETMVAYSDSSADIQDRALAYLDLNCGHCHRPNGPGNTSGLYLQYNETRSNHLGICKPPVAAGKGAGGRSFDIQPGDAEQSILYYRMLTQDPGEMMPELGRSLVHKEGLKLIKEWIENLEGDCLTE